MTDGTQNVYIWIIVILGLAIISLLIIPPIANVLDSPKIINGDCIDMNGNAINPTPDLCNWTCNGHMASPHMQAHLDETCQCCKARGIDYSHAGEYQPRVYVINSDGSQGEDRTCAYYPNATGCV